MIEIRDCDYRGVRTESRVYIEWSIERDGQCAKRGLEHYDLAADPLQLDNLAPAPVASPERAWQNELARRLARLRDCAGIPGRDPDPAPASYCE